MKPFSGVAWFRLSTVDEATAVSCDERGAFVGKVPLLVRAANDVGREKWKPRSAAELNPALSKAYRLPINVSSKADGLAAVARAMNAGHLVLAQIATLHLEFPDLPPLTKSSSTRETTIALAALLHRVGILDIEAAVPLLQHLVDKRDVSREPRIPRGQRGGGRWTVGDVGQNEAAGVIPAQEVIPFPLGPLIRPAPFVRPLPPGALPPDIAPLPLPREGVPVNPYPDNPECAEEWAKAYKECTKLLSEGRLTSGRGFGRHFGECVRGMVSERCGGNPIA